ncbi:MAG: MFS transporter, partial [Leuconostoc mesenteroides]
MIRANQLCFKKILEEVIMVDKKKGQGLPNLPLSTIWMLSFGFLGVQM